MRPRRQVWCESSGAVWVETGAACSAVVEAGPCADSADGWLDGAHWIAALDRIAIGCADFEQMYGILCGCKLDGSPQYGAHWVSLQLLRGRRRAHPGDGRARRRAELLRLRQGAHLPYRSPH